MRRLVLTGLYLLLWPGLVLFLSGDWLWLEGWIFGVWFLALCGGTIGWLYCKDPALLAERFRKPGTGGQKGWDRYVVYGLVLGFAARIVGEEKMLVAELEGYEEYRMKVCYRLIPFVW